MSTALLERLRACLPAPVELRETHAAWVLLSGDTALKLRKPVRFPFLDYSTRDRRLAAAREEVRVNAALAPGLCRGVRALVERDGRIELGPLDETTEAVDYAVEMRRFDERSTMAARCDADDLRPEQVDAIAQLLARFHAAAARCDGGAAAFAARVRTDVRELEERIGPRSTLARYAEAALVRRAAELDARARGGCCRDGHGDLRAEHVVLEAPPLIVDRIEFDPALRRIDVGSDLAFLAMDLELRGCAWAARRLAEAYARAGGDPGGAGLRALFGWQRAIVRAKIALLREDADAAERLLALADRLAWRERLAGVVLVAGPPASGKSTLAGLLAERSGLPVLDSDSTRKRLLGVAPTERLDAAAYSAETTNAVYRELGARAARACAEHGGAIVDATGRSRALRRLLVEQLGGFGPVRAFACDAPAELRLARAEARLADPGRVSDADAAVAQRIAATFEPVTADEDGVDAVVAVDCRQLGEATLDALAAQLDAVAERPG
ncbi:MAG TPA: AAA family ATPase [Conexibacter sp.]|nr:AAA family ATPase [Conexibacter sp.]